MNTTPSQPAASEADQRTQEIFARWEDNRRSWAALIQAQPPVRPCEKHPGTQATLNPDLSSAQAFIYDCPLCQREEQERQLSKRIADGMANSGIPHSVRHASLENFITDRSSVNPRLHHPSVFLLAAVRLAVGEIRNTFFCGPPGIGKSHLGAALARLKIKAGLTVAWTTCPDLFRAYHRSYEGHYSPEDVENYFISRGLLVLDEVCLDSLPKDGERILYKILDRRHDEGLPSILLSNQGAAAVNAWLGGRIMDRLRSGGLSLCYGEWDSLRGTEFDGAHRPPIHATPVRRPNFGESKTRFQSCL